MLLLAVCGLTPVRDVLTFPRRQPRKERPFAVMRISSIAVLALFLVSAPAARLGAALLVPGRDSPVDPAPYGPARLDKPAV